MRRSITAAISAAALAAALAGCGGTSAPAAGSTDPASVSGTITWWDTSDATSEAPAYKALISRFEAQYPKIKVDYVNVPFSDAEAKFKTAAQANNGSAPDVFRSDVGWTAEFAQLGYLAPLDGTPALDQSADYMAGPFATDHYNGKIYGVPEVTDVLALKYNKKIFSDAGISAAPTTWAELKQDALTIKAKTGKTGFYLRGDSYWFLPFLYGEGGDLVDVSAKKVTVNDAKGVAAMNEIRDLITSGAAQFSVSSNSYADAENAFTSGSAAMILNGPWSTSAEIATGTVFNADTSQLGIAEVPAGSVKAGAPEGGHNLVVYAGSSHLTADYLFVKFMNSESSQAFIAQKNDTLPTRTSAYSDPKVTGNPWLAAFAPALKAQVARPQIPQSGDLFTPLTDEFQKMLPGSESATAGLDSAAKNFKTFLPDYAVE